MKCKICGAEIDRAELALVFLHEHNKSLDPSIAIGLKGKEIPVMYDHFMFEGREYMVKSINYPQNTHVEGVAVKVDGKRQTVRARINECEWLSKKEA
jgi:hypothetical protein